MKELLFCIVIVIAIFSIRELFRAYYISHLRVEYSRCHQLTDFHISLRYRIFKRVTDVVISLLVCLSILPLLYVVLGAVIKLTSSGPIIFKHKRQGMFGQEFYCYKFRSMYANVADKKAIRDDKRVTPVGRFIRKTHIDEVPQFYNVLIGEMSLVGPRPLPLREIKKFPNLLQKNARFLVRPGITGLAQIHSGRELPPDVYLEYDLMYVRKQSWLNDVHLMWQTLKFQDVSY